MCFGRFSRVVAGLLTEPQTLTEGLLCSIETFRGHETHAEQDAAGSGDPRRTLPDGKIPFRQKGSTEEVS